MTRLEAWSMHVANVLVGGTGAVYAALHYFVTPTDPFAIVNHPLEPTFQHLHVLFAPLLVFVTGALWQRHVWAKVKSGQRERRSSGWSLILNLAPMVASGYAIQTATDDAWRNVWVGLHLASSAAWLVGYVAHLVSRREGAAQLSAASSSTRG